MKTIAAILAAALTASSPALAYCPGFGCPVVIYQPGLTNLDPRIPLAAGQIPQSFQQGMMGAAQYQNQMLQNQILRMQLRQMQRQ